MSRATIALIVKEVRALAPAWLACLVALILPGLAGRILGAGIAAYVVGAAALGSQIIGREYGNRTLGSLLTLPVPRHRVLFCKLAVLAGMLAILMIVAETFVFGTIRQQPAVDRSAELTALLWVPALLAMSLTPWLTMLCRSALAGAVFSMALPGLMQVAAVLTSSPAAADSGAAFEVAVARTFWTGCFILTAVGALMTWRSFSRLEIVEGGSDAFSMSGLSRRFVVVSVRQPLWLLLMKEIRLQQMAFVVTAGYLLTCLIAILFWPRVADDLVSATSLLYAMFIPPLVGSVASAEERQLGTLDWQLLLPMAAWKQWAVKATAAFTIALVLSLGLPGLLLGMDLGQLAVFAIPVVVVTGVSLYISSLWSNAVWAFLTTIFGGLLTMPLATWLVSLAMANPHQTLVPGIGPAASRQVVAVGLLLLAGCLAIVLGFGLINHRSAEQNRWLVARQLAALSGSLALALVAWLAVTLS